MQNDKCNEIIDKAGGIEVSVVTYVIVSSYIIERARFDESDD